MENFKSFFGLKNIGGDLGNTQISSLCIDKKSKKLTINLISDGKVSEQEIENAKSELVNSANLAENVEINVELAIPATKSESDVAMVEQVLEDFRGKSPSLRRIK